MLSRLRVVGSLVLGMVDREGIRPFGRPLTHPNVHARDLLKSR